MKLVATQRLKYGTRRMIAGDEFEAPDAHGILLVGWRKAREVDSGVSELDKLRARAESLGIKVDRRWGVRRLNDEIGNAE